MKGRSCQKTILFIALGFYA